MIALAGAFAALALSTPATAQDARRLAEADANGDGNIEWQELINMRAAVFARLDRNGDGYADGRDSPRVGPLKSRFDEAFRSVKDADANGDRRISKSEMLNAPAPLFTNGDTNGDQVLSAEEMAALRASAAR
jgi:hypothetical protein